MKLGAKFSILMTLSLVFAVAGAVQAGPITYVVQFSGGGGVGTGSFSFDSGAFTNTMIGPPATFVNFAVPIGGISYVAQSGPDDDAVVNAIGRVTAVDSDLQPLVPVGMEQLVLFSSGHTYTLFDSNNNQTASGTYQIAVAPEPPNFWLMGSALLLSGAGSLRRRFKVKRRPAMATTE